MDNFWQQVVATALGVIFGLFGTIFLMMSLSGILIVLHDIQH